MTATAITAGAALRRRSWRPPALVTRVVLLLCLVGIWQLVVSGGLISQTTIAPPSTVFPQLVRTLRTSQFWSDTGRTMEETVLAFLAAAIAGQLGGLALARMPVFARALEPYLVGAYAMPVIVFYPLLLVLLGLGIGPIIVTAFISSVVPAMLTSAVALRQLSPVHDKLARSLCLSPREAFLKVKLPSALPLLLPGLKLAFIYSLGATVGTEFIVASAGLGFRIGELYRDFETVPMYADIIALVLLAIIVNELFNGLERTVRKDLT